MKLLHRPLFYLIILITISFNALCQNFDYCPASCPEGNEVFLCGQCWTSEAAAAAQGCTETCESSFSGNPIDIDIFTADPSVRVYDDTLWLLPSHDPNNASYWTMVDYVVFSTTDMVNWNEEGLALSSDDVSWGDEWLYAPDFIKRNDTYYLYFPKTESAIGVATSSRPEGPYTDALGEALLDRTNTLEPQRVFDPGIFIDDDEQAYLVFGGGDAGDDARIVKINEDMISLQDDVQLLEGLDRFFEAPYLHKHNGIYYLTYSAKYGNYTTIDYATSTDPMGPYTHQGVLLESVPGWTNHHAVIQYHDKWYLFYHIADGSNYTRRTCIDYLHYNPDGTIETVEQTSFGVEKIRNAVVSTHDEHKRSQVYKLFPVPATTELYIEGDKAIEKFEVIDLQGASRFKGTGTEVNISTLPSGSYILIINDANHLRFEKLAK